jgi:hypothetical protein
VSAPRENHEAMPRTPHEKIVAHPQQQTEQQTRQEGGTHVAHRFPALIAAPPADQGRLWLTGARLWDGTGTPLRENAAVLVEDGVIRRIADAAEPCPDAPARWT